MNGKYEIGDYVLSKWQLVKELGSGAFGKVYEAHRMGYGVLYKAAIKIITIPQSEGELRSAKSEGMTEQEMSDYFEGMVKQIMGECAFMSKVKGVTNIVGYEDHDVIPHEGKVGWDIIIRMELLTPLLEYVTFRDLTPVDTAKLGADICRALEVCRKMNIIHRDIKPENIMISDLGKFKLGDFGISRTLEWTQSGLSKKGTLSYMAPEVAKGEAYGPSVDIYSLGIVMYRFLNHNRIPFMPDPPAPITYPDRENAQARRINGEEIPMPKQADEELGRIVLKACAYSSKDRYESPTALRKDLEAWLRNAGVDLDEEDSVDVIPTGKAEETMIVPAVSSEFPETGQAKSNGGDIVKQDSSGGQDQNVVSAKPEVLAEDASGQSDIDQQGEENPEDEEDEKTIIIAGRKSAASKKKAGIAIGACAGILVVGLAVLLGVLGNKDQKQPAQGQANEVALTEEGNVATTEEKRVVSGGESQDGDVALVTASPEPTEAPTASPESTAVPTASPEPTVKPTATPEPTAKPTATPTSTVATTAQWSDWADSLPNGVSYTSHDIDTRVEYRYRQLQTQTANNQSLASQGWTQTDAKSVDNWSEWSGWSDKEYKKSSTREVETKTLYRSKTKTTTSTDASLKNQGWTLDSTDTNYSAYGSWTGWDVGNPKTGTDLMEVQSQTEYQYRDRTSSQSSAWTDWSAWQDAPVGATATREVRTQQVDDPNNPIYTTYYNYSRWYFYRSEDGAWTSAPVQTVKRAQYEESGWLDAPKKCIGVTKLDGVTPKYEGNWYNEVTDPRVTGYNKKTQYSYHDYVTNTTYSWGDWSGWSTTAVSANDNRQVNTRTLYRNRTRTVSYTYHYSKWSDWSGWSESPISASSSVQVDTKKQYRYKDKTTTTTYTFTKWGDWSNWSATKVNATPSIDVETRTYYRWKSK